MLPGVHTIANLAKKRLPLMVRLAHGSPPLAGGCGPAANKAAQHLFLPELRLLARSDEAGGCASVRAHTSGDLILLKDITTLIKKQIFLIYI
jgi:hypothetical protein